MRLLGVSVEQFYATAQYHDELFREFRLVLNGASEDVRAGDLFSTIHPMMNEFADLSRPLRDAVDSAADCRLTVADVEIPILADAGPWLRDFRDRFREVDGLCSEGVLLSLGPPPDAIRFREWVLREFIDQIDGAEPRRFGQ